MRSQVSLYCARAELLLPLLEGRVFCCVRAVTTSGLTASFARSFAGTSSIVAFYPPWSEGFSYTEESYYTFFDELLQVDVSATAVSGPVTLTVTPLLWVCSPVEAYRGSTDLEEACFWAGDGAPDEYFIIETLPAGSSKRWSLTPDNST